MVAELGCGIQLTRKTHYQVAVKYYLKCRTHDQLIC